MLRDATVVLALACLGWASAGCATECRSVREDYERAERAASHPDAPSRSADRDPPPAPARSAHFAVAARTDLVADVARRLIGRHVRDAFRRSVELEVGAGQPVDIELRPETIDLNVRPSESCDLCLDVAAQIGGEARVRVAGLAGRRVELSGELEAVAPLALDRREDGRVALVLRLADVLRRASTRIDIQMDGLPETWSRALNGALASKLARALADRAPRPVLYTFSPPRLADLPLDLSPVELSVAENGETFAAALRSDRLPLASSAPAGRLMEVAQPGSDRNFGVSFPVAMVGSLLRRGIVDGAIPGRYTRGGRADPAGPVRVMPGAVDVSSTEDGGLKAELNFRGWMLDSSRACLGFRAAAVARARPGPNGIDASIRSVRLLELSDAGAGPSLASWTGARFLETGRTVLSTSLSPSNTSFLDGEFEMGRARLESEEEIASLKTRVRPTSQRAEEDANRSGPSEDSER